MRVEFGELKNVLEKNFPDTDSVLDILFENWIDDDPVYCDGIRNLYRELGQYTKHPELKRIDRVDDIVANLCIAYSRAAFRAGIRVGARLILELSEV